MSNHSSDFPEQDGPLAHLIRAQAKEMRLGATGQWPWGKLDKKDDGELRFAVAVDSASKTLILSFGKPVEWFGMKKENAIELGNLLLKRAEEL